MQSFERYSYSGTVRYGIGSYLDETTNRISELTKRVYRLEKKIVELEEDDE